MEVKRKMRKRASRPLLLCMAFNSAPLKPVHLLTIPKAKHIHTFSHQERCPATHLHILLELLTLTILSTHSPTFAPIIDRGVWQPMV